VYVRDPRGDRSEYFYSTDARMSPRRIIELFAARWSVEVTFQEVRAHLGWETTRQRQRRSVLRAAPCLLGCFSVVSLIYARHVRSHPTAATTRGTLCYHKTDVTFSDALFTVRRLIWSQTLLNQWFHRDVVAKSPYRLKTLLLDHLAEAA
jgi:hypothetical protein